MYPNHPPDTPPDSNIDSTMPVFQDDDNLSIISNHTGNTNNKNNPTDHEVEINLTNLNNKKRKPQSKRGSFSSSEVFFNNNNKNNKNNNSITIDSINEKRNTSDDYDKSDKVVIRPVNDEDDLSVIITFNQGISPFIIILTFVTSISGFLFGYDTGYISSALVSIDTDLSHRILSYGDKEIITAATSLGALITSIFAGTAADIFGRKPCIMFSNILFLIGAILQITANTFWQMAAGRLVMGFGVGIGSLIAPLFISEIAPKMIRGRLTVINSLCLTGGQLIAYGCGAGLNHVNNGWRILVGLSLIPTVAQFCLFFFLPDTPRYYVLKGDYENAKYVLQKSYTNASDEVIDKKIHELAALNKSIPGKNRGVRIWNTIKELHTVPSNFRALIIACGLQAIQQFTGWNSLMYFSGTIFETVGFSNSTAVSIIVSGTNFIFTLVAFFAIDKIGRRYILLIGLPGMTMALTMCSIAFHFIGIKFNGNDATVANEGFSAWGIVIIVFIILFAAFYALGIGTVPWQQSELFPTNVRGIGTSYATAVNWAGSLVIASTFLTMLQNITPTGTFAFFAGLSALSVVFCYFCYPELSGLELEEVQTILKDGFNIKASRQLAKKRKQQIAAAGDLHDIKLEPTQEIIED